MKLERCMKGLAVLLVLVFAIYGKNVGAQSICDGPKGCTTEEWALEASWVAQELIELPSKRSRANKVLYSSCIDLVTIKVANLLDQNKPVTQAKFKKLRADLQKNQELVSNWYKSCRNDMSEEEFSSLLHRLLSERRPKTKFETVLSDPASFMEKSFRVDGYGQYLMNMFYLRRSPDDLNPLIVEMESVPTYLRERLVLECGKATVICKVTVTGRIKETNPFLSVTLTAFPMIQIHTR